MPSAPLSDTRVAFCRLWLPAPSMVRGVDTGLTVESVLPGPIKLHSKAAAMQRSLKTTTKGAAGRVITQVASYGFAMGEENARGHIIVTAPTAGSAGIIPAVVKSLRDLKTPTQKIRDGFLAAAAIGYLCKHNATLSGAEGGCQAEVGVGSSMRDLLTRSAPEARLAVDYFVYRAAKEIGALAAVLGGVDGLVFTAGIGENSPEIRRRICEASSWLGVELDARANINRDARISTQKSKVSTWVIPTNEELMIARHTGALLGLTSTHGRMRLVVRA